MASESQQIRQFGKFRLDVQKKVLWHEGEPVNLPLKEIEVLCVLTEDGGQVVTKNELLEKIWGDSFVAGMTVILSRRDYEAARAAAEESVGLFRELESLALSLSYLGVILWFISDDEQQVVKVLKESEGLFRELGDGWGVSGPLLYLGAIRQEHGDNAAARASYEEAIALGVVS